jgi:dienelactone hydrolase
MCSPVTSQLDEPQVQRWTEQRWLIDNIIRANGPDWDQPRLANLNAALGPETTADVAGIRARIQKFSDMSPAFVAAAERREARARAAEAAGEPVTARDNYFYAANYWASAQWPLDTNCEDNIKFNTKKRSCFESYAKLADHHVEAAWIPFQGKALPGWLHLPPGYTGGRLPVVISIPGMDGFKERSVSLYGDRWLNRGIAVLVVEGPGQYESAVLDIHVSVPAWAEAGTAIVDWLVKRPDIDPERIGIIGSSFGTFFSTICVAHEKRIRACAIVSTCLEPGCHTIFEEACPTFKRRFMYMAGYTDEEKFNEFCETLTWQGYAENIQASFLCVAGESDELSPLVYTEKLMRTIPSPRTLLVYQDCRHVVGNVPAANLGPNPQVYMAEWMLARFAGKPLESAYLFVEASGKVRSSEL